MSKVIFYIIAIGAFVIELQMFSRIRVVQVDLDFNRFQINSILVIRSERRPHLDVA